jgi:hypothetical protein
MPRPGWMWVGSVVGAGSHACPPSIDETPTVGTHVRGRDMNAPQYDTPPGRAGLRPAPTSDPTPHRNTGTPFTRRCGQSHDGVPVFPMTPRPHSAHAHVPLTQTCPITSPTGTRQRAPTCGVPSIVPIIAMVHVRWRVVLERPLHGTTRPSPTRPSPLVTRSPVTCRPVHIRPGQFCVQWNVETEEGRRR